MSKTTIEQFHSDLSGELIEHEQPEFRVWDPTEGRVKALHLTAKEQERFGKLIAPLLEHAWEVEQAPSTPRRRRVANPDAPTLPEGVTAAEAKKVLAELGYIDLPQRGKLRPQLIEAYINRTPAPVTDATAS